MSITVARKQELISDYARKAGDTGSPEVQVAILSERIRNLTDHLTTHKNARGPAALRPHAFPRREERRER